MQPNAIAVATGTEDLNLPTGLPVATENAIRAKVQQQRAQALTVATVTVPATVTVKKEDFWQKLGHGLEDVVDFLPRLIKILNDTSADAPAVKSAIATIVTDAKALAATLSPALTAGGGNVVADTSAVVGAIPEIVQLVEDFNKLFPLVEGAIKTLEGDATGTTTAPAPASDTVVSTATEVPASS